MKSIAIVILCVVSAASTLAPKPAFNIPLFILDTEHPWILQNKDLLNAQPQIEAALCAADPNHPALLDLRQRYPQLTPPIDLFYNIYIGRPGDPRPGYHNMINRLEEILACPAALLRVQFLEINLELIIAEATGASYKDLYGVDTSKLDTSNPRDY